MTLRRLRRPATATTPAFDLAYVRTGPRSATPLVVVPGGPGLCSVVPYGAVRRWGARGGLDIVMVEHRGVGLSRRDVHGRRLPRAAMRIRDVADDLVAVLDSEGIDRAYVVGSSYGSYLASSLAAWHPDRVAGLLLDSALQSAHDLPLERDAVRAAFLGGDEIGSLTRALVDSDADQRILLDVVRAAYELVGPDLVRRILRQRVAGASSFAWHALRLYATRNGSTARIPYVYDFDLAGVIGFRELDYGAAPDGLPLDPALTYSLIARHYPPFEGEPVDLVAAASGFRVPVVLLVGSRDLRTPPAIAERVAATAPDAVMVEIDNGHSALDSHPLALLNAARSLVRGTQAGLPPRAGRLSALPRRGATAAFARALQRTS